MNIEEYANDDAVVWVLSGPLTGDASEVLVRAVNRAAHHGWRRIVMDLAWVSMMDAGGLGALVTVYRASGGSLIALSLARVPKRVRYLLVITQLTAILAIFDSVEQALRNNCSLASAAVSLPASPRLREPAESSSPRESVDLRHGRPTSPPSRRSAPARTERAV